MKVLIVGGGGREHALAAALSKSPRVSSLACAPGNGGIAKLARCFDIKATDIGGICALADREKFDLVVVAPDDPLCLGLVDELEGRGHRAFGPGKAAAIIEGSKAFSKELMKKYSIPTAKYEVFDSPAAALEYLKTQRLPIVIKADGLALGKGVVIAQTMDEAQGAVRSMMEEGRFGAAGSRVVIEEFLTGQEISVLAFTDGKTLVPMVSAQDHKRVFDNDQGPNTGGMGAFSPSRIYDEKVAGYCMEHIFLPTMHAMNAEGRTFKGVLYFGLIVTGDGVFVIEYNCRFGDPEAQAVLPRLETDLLQIMEAVIDGRLGEIDIRWSGECAACVVMASGGYPGPYETGKAISGLDRAQAAGAFVFHAGTAEKDGRLVTAGGRVLGVTARGETVEEAAQRAYRAVAEISFEGAHWRRDIGKK